MPWSVVFRGPVSGYARVMQIYVIDGWHSQPARKKHKEYGYELGGDSEIGRKIPVDFHASMTTRHVERANIRCLFCSTFIFIFFKNIYIYYTRKIFLNLTLSAPNSTPNFYRDILLTTIIWLQFTQLHSLPLTSYIPHLISQYLLLKSPNQSWVNKTHFLPQIYFTLTQSNIDSFSQHDPSSTLHPRL